MPITRERPRCRGVQSNASRTWFDKELINQAVAEGRNEIVHRGIRFSIERGHRFRGDASKLEYECALVKRADGDFAPMAYVRLFEEADRS